MTNSTSIILTHGGYKNLKSFQMAEIIFDFTSEFVQRYISPKSRTRDQMEQAARSGTRNIGEGSQTSGTSKKSELRLVDVARASLQELLDDYTAFLRQKNLKQWNKDSPQAAAVRQIAYKSNKSYATYKSYLSSPEMAANAAICLINQTNYLLDQQLRSLAADMKDRGIGLEPHRQKLARILSEQQKREKDADEWVKSFLPKEYKYD